MRFADYTAELLRTYDQRERLDHLSARRWDLGDFILSINARPKYETTPYEHKPTTYVACGGFWLEWDAAPAGTAASSYARLQPHSLSADQLRRVALCRDVFERWCAGDLAELPTDPPEGARKVLASFRGDGIPGRPS